MAFMFELLYAVIYIFNNHAMLLNRCIEVVDFVSRVGYGIRQIVYGLLQGFNDKCLE